jgi:hypothetical protein
VGKLPNFFSVKRSDLYHTVKLTGVVHCANAGRCHTGREHLRESFYCLNIGISEVQDDTYVYFR